MFSPLFSKATSPGCLDSTILKTNIDNHREPDQRASKLDEKVHSSGVSFVKNGDFSGAEMDDQNVSPKPIPRAPLSLRSIAHSTLEKRHRRL